MIFKWMAAAFTTVFAAGTLAHGIPKPKHGGWVDTGSETSFELVQARGSVVVYVEDHGKPMMTDGGHAEILLSAETGKLLARLSPSGANALSGPAVPVRKGDRLFVRVTFRNGSSEVGEIVVP